MKNNASLLYSFALVIGDFVALVIAFVLAFVLRYKLGLGVSNGPLITPESGSTYVRVLVTTIPAWLAIFGLLGLYNKNVYEKRFSELGRLFIGAVMGVLVAIAWQFFTRKSIFPARLLPIYVLLVGFGSLVIIRSLECWFRRVLFGFGFGINNVMIVGDTPATQELARMLRDTRGTGYRIVGVIGSEKFPVEHVRENRIYNSFSTAIVDLKNEQIHSILQTQLYADPQRNDEVLSYAQANHIAYRFVPGNSELFVGNIDVDLFRSIPVIAVHQTALVGWGRIVKRLFDFGFGLVAFIVALPIILIIALLMIIFDHGDPIFKQERLSRFNSKIYIYKFRTYNHAYNRMTPEQGFAKMGKPELAKKFRDNGDFLEKDPRISRLGRFLRSTSLDELPQLWNVVKGDLSLVGPRPLEAFEMEAYTHKNLVLSVKTGLTGLAVVSGRRNIPFEERRKLDLYYVQNWSFWGDIVILIKTVWMILSRAGAK